MFHTPRVGEIFDVVQADPAMKKAAPRAWNTWRYEVCLTVSDPDGKLCEHFKSSKRHEKTFTHDRGWQHLQGEGYGLGQRCGWVGTEFRLPPPLDPK